MGFDRERTTILCALRVEQRWLQRMSFGRYAPPNCCGPGAGNVKRWLNAHRPAALIFAGLAGSLTPQINAGSAFLIHEVIDSRTANGWTVPIAPVSDHQRCRVVSIDSVVTHAADRAALRNRFQADLVDMESAAIALWASEAKIPWAIVRGVSDGSTATALPPESADWVDARGDTRIAAVLASVIRKPRLVADLMRLRRDSRRAIRGAAQLIAELCRGSNAGIARESGVRPRLIQTDS